MWRNYLTVGLRALAKNKTYAFINIFGLALGLAACLILLLYVRYEFSYEEWMPDADRVFQVQTFITDPETGETTKLQATAAPVAATLQKDFPQIEAISQASFDNLTYRHRGETSSAPMMAVAEPFFDIVGVRFLAGNPQTAMREANSLVLSESQAVAMFGTANVVGRTVTRVLGSGDEELRVTGVFEDFPKNSHMDFKAFAKADPETASCWGCINGYVYGKLKPGADVESINSQLAAWERRNIPNDGPGGESAGDNADWRLVGIRDVHLGEAQQASPRPGNDRRTILTFAIIAFLILGMACMNFTNLATARASQRAREVALRKVLGANRRQLVVQFLGESLLISALAMLLALAMVELALPAFSAFLDADLSIRYLGESGVLLPILGLVLLVGLAGGIYPAFYLSRFKPASVLKANKSASDTRGSGRLRSVLVVAQFAISIGLIICTAIVYGQTVYAQTADPGYEREGLLQIANIGRPQVPLETLKNEIARIDGVSGAAATQLPVAGEQIRRASVFVPGRDRPVELGYYSVDPDVFGVMKMRLLVGRLLSEEHANDDARIAPGPDGEPNPEAIQAIQDRGINVVVNALGAERLGFGDPAAAIGKQINLGVFGNETGTLPATIVGVVADARFRSVRDPVEATIFHNNGDVSDLVVRFENASPEAIRQRAGEVWKRVVSDVPYEAEFAEERVAELYEAEQARGQTFAGFAILAVVIACLGLFGLAAFTAERRTKEIGIRKVLGARSKDIVRLLAWQFSKPVILANLIAWPIAWWLMRDWLNGFDARIDLGPGPFVMAGLLALAIAIGTIAGHALKVARANPIHALRYE